VAEDNIALEKNVAIEESCGSEKNVAVVQPNKFDDE